MGALLASIAIHLATNGLQTTIEGTS